MGGGDYTRAAVVRLAVCRLSPPLANLCEMCALVAAAAACGDWLTGRRRRGGRGGRDLYTCLLFLSRGERRGLLNPLQSPSRFSRRREEEEEEETALD